MQAFELVKNQKDKEPAKEETKDITREAYRNGIILLSSGLYSNVIRILVPLVITNEQLNTGLDIIERVIKKFDSILI